MLSIQKILADYTDNVVNLLEDTALSSDSFAQAGEVIRKTELLVPVIGAFSAGKSSLLNAFLQKDVLAVGLTPETELATEIRYGTQPHVLALRPDGSSERVELADMPGIKSRSGEFTHLQLYLDSPYLQRFSSLVLVDMPGFDSSLENHNKAIAHYLPRGVHFIVVTSIEDGTITRSVLRHIDALDTYSHKFTYVLHKTNLRAEADVDQVAELIAGQIQQQVIRVGQDGHERMLDILSALQPEQIFRNLFVEQLQDLTHALLSQIGLALAALDRDQEQNDQARMELEKGIRSLLEKRDELLSRLQAHTIDQIVADCLSKVERELEAASEELTTAGLSGNQQAFSLIVSDVVRGTLTRAVNQQLNAISQSVVSELSESIRDLGSTLGEFTQEPDWLAQTSNQIQRGMERTGEVFGALTSWAESLANQNKAKGIFRGLATILAVTTSMVTPAIELAIIFLPDILGFFQKDKKREQFKEKIQHEIIPAIKRELREKLTAQLAEQVQNMVKAINARFEQELNEKKCLIEEMGANQEAAALAQRKERLLAIRNTLQQLAEKALYQG